MATPTQPTLSLSDASVIEGNPSGGAAPGWLSTSRAARSSTRPARSVQIAGVNWFGFENNDLAPHGSGRAATSPLMDQMVDLGFNTIRLPFSERYAPGTGTPNINYSANPDLRGSPLCRSWTRSWPMPSRSG